MEPREGREEEERGKEGGRRGEAHNTMGHGSWTDSICSQLSVVLVMDGEVERHREQGKEGDRGRKRWKKEEAIIGENVVVRRRQTFESFHFR